MEKRRGKLFSAEISALKPQLRESKNATSARHYMQNYVYLLLSDTRPHATFSGNRAAHCETQLSPYNLSNEPPYVPDICRSTTSHSGM